jgi:predicted phage terminase large subunit-like protein
MKADIEREIARRDIKYFVKRTQRDYLFAKFNIEILNNLEIFLQDVIAGKRPILIIQAPPQHGKSELASRKFPAYAFGKNPDFRIAGCSYGADLATSINRDIQKIMLSDEYTRIFQYTRLNANRVVTLDNTPLRNSERFDIVGRRGYYVSAGVGGSLTGKSVDIGIIDDPIKNMQEALSETIRDNLVSWYRTVFLTRLSKNSGQLIMATRWTIDDLTGFIIEANKDNERVKILQFPAINEANQALHSGLHPIEQLEEQKRAMDISSWSALYQQEPIIEGGNLFKRSMFEIGECPDEFDYSLVTGDTAYKEKERNDYTVLASWGVKDGLAYLRAIWRQQISSDLIEKYAIPFIVKANQYGFRGAFIEPKGHGIYLNQRLPKLGVPMPPPQEVEIFFKDRRFDKFTRANAIMPYMAFNTITISDKIDKQLIDAIISEFLAFPNGKHDDATDCLIDGVKYIHTHAVSILDVL